MIESTTFMRTERAPLCERVEFNGVSYDPRYIHAKQTMINLLQITADETDRMVALVQAGVTIHESIDRLGLDPEKDYSRIKKCVKRIGRAQATPGRPEAATTRTHSVLRGRSSL